MPADDLTKALLVEEVASPRAIAEALFASVNGGVPLLEALVDSGASTPDTLARILGRSDAPFLRQVIPLQELMDRLPRGICQRLLALPVRLDAITGTVDVVVANVDDPHPAQEIAFHLQAPVRVVRATVAAIEEALRRVRMTAGSALHANPQLAPAQDSPGDRFREAAAAAQAETHRTSWGLPPALTSRLAQEEELYDSRRAASAPRSVPPNPAFGDWAPTDRMVAPPRTHREESPPRRGGLVIDTDDSAPPPAPAPPPRMRTPPWGTPIHMINAGSVTAVPSLRAPTEPPVSGYGSEIPIPLTRKTYHPGMIRGGTERPPILNPKRAGLGEGYDIDTAGLRDVVEKTPGPRIREDASSVDGPRRATRSPSAHGSLASMPPFGQPIGSFIPGPPPLPGMGPFAAYAPNVDAPAQTAGKAGPDLPFPEMSGILAALRNAGSRDEVLELVLTGARMVALKVALFVVKKGGYLGWVGTPEFADRAALQSVLIPLSAPSIFDRAVREDLFLGPIRYDEIHAPLLRIMRNPSRDVAVVPIRVSGKTAVIILADELGDTMIGTRRLEELARAAGEAFTRIVRTRR